MAPAVTAPGSRAETPGSDTVEPGSKPAVHGVMAALAWVPRLVLLHLGWVALVLVGGVLPGLAPATATMVALLRREGGFGQVDGGSRLVRAVLARYWAELGPANRAAGPFLLIALAAGMNVVLGIAGALPTWFFPVGFVASMLLGVLALTSSAHAVVLHVLRPGSRAFTLWAGALAGPFLLPVATVSWMVTLCATAVIGTIIQPIGWFMSGGAVIAVTTVVLARTWQSRLDAVQGRR
ncbi:DUF624 domain-containing protein [Brachybacterium massiliense]|uniref:DUF624 domain-containing protein n=1 Tax=Brachybacterium massiliense TaxID=1755098 RepID=UPI00111F9819|nr:DUF624 domain-containing protein [Brachybacterium massiliense]